MNLEISDKFLADNIVELPQYCFVGLTATGNRTAGRAMASLGYSWSHYPQSIEDARQVQVVTDTSIAMWFRKGLLSRNAVYVLTIRELDSWLDDCETWYESRPISTLNFCEEEIRKYLFGGVEFDRNRFADFYYIHCEACSDVADQMGVKLHCWDVVGNPGWGFLENLTGRSTSMPFPYVPGGGLKTWELTQI